MIDPVIPSDNLVIIQIIGGRCRVARYYPIRPHTFRVQPAFNWEALESDARQAVEDQVGAIVEDEHYPCPAALAARAEWG